MPDISEQLRRYASAVTDATSPVTFDDLRRPVRRSPRVPVAVAAVILVAVAVAALAWSAGTDSSSISTVDDGSVRRPEAPEDPRPPTTLATDVPAGDDGIAPRDPALRIDPEGPYRDGQQVVLTWPEGHISDWMNERPLFCSVVADDPDGPAETCDPLHGPTQRTGTATEVDVVLSQRVFTPTGHRDCADAAVTCRLLHRRTDGTYGASAPLQFTGEPAPPSASLSVTEGADPRSFVVDPDGITPHPSWLELRDRDPSRVAGYPAFFLQLCAFGSSEAQVAPYGTYLWLHSDGPYTNCDATAPTTQINSDDPNAPVTLSTSGRVHGYGGWSDCRVDHCFVQIRQTVVEAVDEDRAVHGYDNPVVAAVVPFAPTTPLPDPPSIEVVDPGPHVAGQTLTVVVRDLPEGATTNIGVCNVSNPWGCGYLAEAFDLTNGTHEITLPDTLTACPANTCYLELDAQGEGLPPLATAPLDTRS